LARSIPPIEDLLILAGLDAHCASVRAWGLGTAEVDADPAAAVEAILEQAARAVAGDGVAAAVAVALVGLGVSTSKVGVYAEGPENPRTHWPLSTTLGLDA
jgi:allantoin racemase